MIYKLKNPKLLSFKNHILLLKSKNKYFKINLETCSFEYITILKGDKNE